MPATTETHYLHFLANEDEAQMTGYKFEVYSDRVVVSQTFYHPEYAGSSRTLSKAAARTLWRELIATGDYEPIVRKKEPAGC